VQHLEVDGARAHVIPLVDVLVDHGNRRRGSQPQPLRLHGEELIEAYVGLVEHDRGARPLAQGVVGSHVVDVGVRVHDGAAGEAVLREHAQDARQVVARIDHDGVAGRGIAQDRAVALQRPHGEGLDDHRGPACRARTASIPTPTRTPAMASTA
jgi:hypothetical protein